MAYIPLPRREPRGFYNPNMPGPDWAAGIASLLGGVEARREQKRAREKEKWERGVEERKLSSAEASAKTSAETYAKDVETRRLQYAEPKPSAQERLWNKQLEDAERIFPDTPEGKQQAYLFASRQVPSTTGSGGSGKTTQVDSWISKGESKFGKEVIRFREIASGAVDELKELTDQYPDLQGVSQDPTSMKTHRKMQDLRKTIDYSETAIQGLLQGIDIFGRMRGAWQQNNQHLTPELNKAITGLSTNMEAVKRGDFSFLGVGPEQAQPGVGGGPDAPAGGEMEIHPYIKQFLEKHPEAANDPATMQRLMQLNQQFLEQQR